MAFPFHLGRCYDIREMIILYQSGGAGDFELLRPAFKWAENRNMILNAQRLLGRRGFTDAAKLLRLTDFAIWQGTNSFRDDFCVLYAVAPFPKYESIRVQIGRREDFARIAAVLTEIGPFIRFIACELRLEATPLAEEEHAMAHGDILKLVNEYIGVHGGYLGDFTYRSHEDFYPQFCELELDSSAYEGTTRARFIQILGTVDKIAQAKIIRGVLKKFPVGSEPCRTQALRDYFNSLAGTLEGSVAVADPNPRIASDVLKRALADAETLIRKNGAVSAVDRIHTALHGYLKVVCDRAKIEYSSDPSLTQLFKLLRENHPAFAGSRIGSEEINKILRGCAAIIDALNPLRNRASVAHPNDSLLADEEAMLVVNLTRSILHYLDTKLSSQSKS